MIFKFRVFHSSRKKTTSVESASFDVKHLFFQLHFNVRHDICCHCLLVCQQQQLQCFFKQVFYIDQICFSVKLVVITSLYIVSFNDLISRLSLILISSLHLMYEHITNIKIFYSCIQIYIVVRNHSTYVTFRFINTMTKD